MKSIDELLELEPGLEYLGLTNLKKKLKNYQKNLKKSSSNMNHLC